MIEEEYLLAKIKKFPKVYQKYTYSNEESVNPFYYDIEHSPILCVGESRIWALRTDLIMAVGIKNAYNKSRGSTIFDRADASVRHYINERDRYGHPSLITPYDGYDGSVYIAGWVFQNLDHLEIIMWSGRYNNDALKPSETQIIEQYLALQFMKAWGEQKILFLYAGSEQYLTLFFNGFLTREVAPYRIYESYKSIINEMFYNCIISFDVDYTLKILSTYPYLKDEALDSKGNTVFWIFAEQGHVLGLDLLEKLGVDINQKNSNNETALHIAARDGNYTLVRILIYSGASQISLNADNKTPVDVATDNAIVAFLETDIICQRVNEILTTQKTLTADVVGVIAKHYYSSDEQSAFRILHECKDHVIRHYPDFLEQYELDLEAQLQKEKNSGLIRIIKSGFTCRAVNMLNNECKDLINVIIDDSGNTPLIYFAIKKDWRGVGRLLTFDGIDIDHVNACGYTFKDYLAFATESFIDSLAYFCIENADIKLFISRLKSLFSFEKNLEKYISWSNSAKLSYYFFSIYSWADLYKEAKKLISTINLLRLNWSDEKYLILKDDYRDFCSKTFMQYYEDYFENDETEETLQLGRSFQS